MSGYSLASPAALSGGERQLVAIAAVIAIRPKLLVFDEVFSPLDETASRMVKNLIADLTAAGGGVLLVEHEDESLAIANRVLRMEGRRVCEAAHG
jgi:energy-coupling factor transporter ATP-binding protein EcfA2